ncbi:L-lactate MFS transporter [Ferrimonas gelatinilytica]|uniref:OFA family MFS transporter n=1 Tax=Ferrimonas gelatinilytica TaxID=1255257 RepID=A0ABP9RZZ6_9GAMM
MNRAIKILIAGVCINLCLGVLYTWSVFSQALVSDMGWSNTDAGMPYTVSIVVFAIALLISGILQDRWGPRPMAVLGTALTGVGMVGSAFATTPSMLVLTFGIITGAGIGFAFACLAPTAMKWFPPSRKGLVSGIIAAGFGVAPLYLAPTTTALISQFGINQAFLYLGIGVLVIALPMAFTIVTPPTSPSSQTTTVNQGAAADTSDFTWREMIRTPQFYMMWGLFALGSSAGLMLIGNITSIALVQGGVEDGALLVATLAVFNTLGRIVMGMLSDKIGRIQTLWIVLLLQGLNMVLFPIFTTELGFLIGAALAGIAYGGLLSVVPSLTADFYGLNNYGTNYGVLYTAWGVAGFMGPVLANEVVDHTGSFGVAYLVSAVTLGVAVALALMLKPVRKKATAPSGELLTA